MIKNVDDDDNDVLPSEVAASYVRLTWSYFSLKMVPWLKVVQYFV